MTGRHCGLLCMVSVAISLNTPAAAQEKSWVGQAVMPVRPESKIRIQVLKDGVETTFPLGNLTTFTVREEQKGRLRLFDGRREGWVDRADFVLAKEATSFFDQMAKDSPKDKWTLNMRAVAWTHKGDYDTAIVHYTTYLRLYPTDALAFNNRGICWFRKKDLERALRDYDESIRLKPTISPFFNNRGTLWLEKKDHDRAIQDFSEAIRLDPKNVLAHRNRARCHLARKDYDQAIRDLDEVLRRDPNEVFSYRYRGGAWASKREYDRAIADYDAALRLKPKDLESLLSRGHAHHGLKNHDRAIADYSEALLVSKKSVRALNGRGLARLAQKEYDAARKDFEEASRLDPKGDWAPLNLAVVEMLNRRPAARALDDLAQRKGPKSPQAAYLIILGHLAARLEGDEATARRILSDSAGKLAEAWPSKVVRFLSGDLDEATLLKEATDTDRQTEARCYLALDHLLRGRKDEAIKHLRWVKDNGTTTFLEYVIASAELERLEGTGKLKD